MRNIQSDLDRLRKELGHASRSPRSGVGEHAFSLGSPAFDMHFGSGFRRATTHEVYAVDTQQAQIANGFALGLALRLHPKTLVWIVHLRGLPEAGLPYGPGLLDWGLDPASLILVRVKDASQLLAAGEEALASGAAEAVILSGWGEAKAISLTASRRLTFAAARGGATGFFVRAGAQPAPSTAETRWSVRAAPSLELEARSPGRPAFRAALLRSRAGEPLREWIMEWDRETRSFVEPSTSGGLVSLPRHRPAGEVASLAGRAA